MSKKPTSQELGGRKSEGLSSALEARAHIAKVMSLLLPLFTFFINLPSNGALLPVSVGLLLIEVVCAIAVSARKSNRIARQCARNVLIGATIVLIFIFGSFATMVRDFP